MLGFSQNKTKLLKALLISVSDKKDYKYHSMLLLRLLYSVSSMVGYKTGRALVRKNLIGEGKLPKGRRNCIKILDKTMDWKEMN